MLANIILMIHVIAAATIIGLVLVQHGKGADMGAAFGSGSAGSLFGSSGAGNFLSRATAVAATVFFFTSIGLTYFHAPRAAKGVMSGTSVTEPAKTESKDAIPVTPATPVTTATPAVTTAPAGDLKSKEIPK